MLINADNWLKMATKKFRVFTLFEPDHLTVFKSVTILGNRFTDSLLHRCWSKIGVQFVSVEDAVLRQPVTPIGERLEVKYFSNRKASFNYFRDEADPLRTVQDWCRKALGNYDVYYTVNSAFLGSFTFPGQERISVLAHGHNKLKDKTVGIFMAAMKGKPQEYAMIRDVFGVTKDEFDRAREYEALYQFVMRSNLRVYDSDKKVDMYVFSKAQAEFLHKITGAPIAKQDVGLNDSINKGGRPKGSIKNAARLR